MGFIFSKSMNENLKSQQEFMLMNSRLQCGIMEMGKTALDAEIRTGKTATDAESNARETDGYANCLDKGIPEIFWSIFGIAAVGLTAGAIKNKKPRLFLPMIPLSFILAYQYDMAYGTLLQRMKGEAENILDTENTLLEMPKGALTFESIEKARRAQSRFFIEK